MSFMPQANLEGFSVDDIGAQGFNVEIKIYWSKQNRPTADEVQTSLTSVYGKAFEEVEKRLGE